MGVLTAYLVPYLFTSPCRILARPLSRVLHHLGACTCGPLHLWPVSAGDWLEDHQYSD